MGRVKKRSPLHAGVGGDILAVNTTGHPGSGE